MKMIRLGAPINVDDVDFMNHVEIRCVLNRKNCENDRLNDSRVGSLRRCLLHKPNSVFDVLSAGVFGTSRRGLAWCSQEWDVDVGRGSSNSNNSNNTGIVAEWHWPPKCGR